jgi:hypothetical protein
MGGTIRTISVSVLAIVAIAAGLLFSRSREHQTLQGVKVDEGVEGGAVELEALRRAGF